MGKKRKEMRATLGFSPGERYIPRVYTAEGRTFARNLSKVDLQPREKPTNLAPKLAHPNLGFSATIFFCGEALKSLDNKAIKIYLERYIINVNKAPSI